MEFCEKLQELTKQKGLTQEQLATALFVSRTAVSKSVVYNVTYVVRDADHCIANAKPYPKCMVKKAVLLVIYAFTVFVIGGRLVSGVHWLSDIVGAILLCLGFVLVYDAVCD